jgi:hypothetical protein
MNNQLHFSGSRETARSGADDTLVCWSRMQAEAGEKLEMIVRRKELERQGNGGIFLWGVGNAPARLVKTLALGHRPVRAIFSIMKSKPKPIDENASDLLLWRAYVDAEGVERALPPSSIVTSRAISGTRPKLVHYALMCRSTTRLSIERGGPRFDPAAFRNAGDRGGPVGASQVTALLRQISGQRQEADYEVNMAADLFGSYWVRLCDPVMVNKSVLPTIDDSGSMTAEDWTRLAKKLRDNEPRRSAWGLLV